VQETKLAWALAEAVKPHLSAVERDRVFVSIGAGETFAAIRHLCRLAAVERIPLRSDLVQQCATWLHAYAGREDAGYIHQYLGSTHLHLARHRPPSQSAVRGTHPTP
jgi:hypothetical protein